MLEVSIFCLYIESDCLLRYGQKLRPRIWPLAQISPHARAQLRSIEEDLLLLFEAFKVGEMASEDADTYFEAKDYIMDQYRAFYSGTAARVLRWYIGTMVTRLGGEFHQKLNTHDPLAMALLARMLVLMHALDKVWWMNGVGAYKVLERDIPGLEKLMPPELRWTMRWPCSVLDGSVELCRSRDEIILEQSSIADQN